MSKNVTVILNGFRRPHALKAQIESIKRQTVTPASVMFWQNGATNECPFDYDLLKSCIVSMNNQNFGVWARFAYALNAETEYVCVFDDDTITGSKWLESCLNTIEEYNGLLGTNGVIFNDLDYQSYTQHGWAKPNEKTEQVDIVGHSWFLKENGLEPFGLKLPNHKVRCAAKICIFHTPYKSI